MIRSIFHTHRLCVVTVLMLMLSAPTPAEDFHLADRVLVKKSERKLYLLHDGEILESYDIHLGGNPLGHKLREGDSRTPEGRYRLDWKNFHSDYFLSIHVSYPNDADRRRAQRRGWQPGGLIMIHGFPSGEAGRRVLDNRGYDWTDGCIAVSNRAMIEIWDRVAEDTPITILP